MTCDLESTKMWITFLEHAGSGLVTLLMFYCIFRFLFGGDSRE